MQQGRKVAVRPVSAMSVDCGSKLDFSGREKMLLKVYNNNYK
jgi:hypothetical protein